MKEFVLCVLVVLLLAATVQAAESYGGKSNYMSFALGAYAPSEDLRDEGYKSGADFCFSYMRTISNYFGFGAGVHTYTTDSSRTKSDIGDGDIASFGIEGLFYVQPNSWRIQPYLALGPAIYFNGLEYEQDIDDEKVDESGSGLGYVAKLGVRAFFTKRFFGGIVVKGFGNHWNLEIEDGKDKTYQFGGSALSFQLGFTF